MKLDGILRTKSMKTQCVLLCAWLVELKLDRLNKLETQSNNVETSEVMSPSRRASTRLGQSAYREVCNNFYDFLSKYEKHLDGDTILQLLQNHGRNKECMEFADQKVININDTLGLLRVHDTESHQ